MNEKTVNPPKAKPKKWLSIIARYGFVFLLGYLVHPPASGLKRYDSGAEANWMPDEASDGISLNYGVPFAPFFCYEFDISEKGFVAFAEARGKVLQEIEEPVGVRRYLAYYIRRNEFRHRGDYEEAERLYAAITRPRISDGLYYQKIGPGDDLTVYVYDRVRGRAFVVSVSR